MEELIRLKQQSRQTNLDSDQKKRSNSIGPNRLTQACYATRDCSKRSRDQVSGKSAERGGIEKSKAETRGWSGVAERPFTVSAHERSRIDGCASLSRSPALTHVLLSFLSPLHIASFSLFVARGASSAFTLA